MEKCSFVALALILTCVIYVKDLVHRANNNEEFFRFSGAKRQACFY
jgi:hypothetical protein